MPAAKGTRPPAAGKGRVAGTPNKMTRDVKEMILGALNELGGQAWLVGKAEENTAAFLTLVGKVLPLTLAGDPANPLHVKVSQEERRRQAREAIAEAFAEKDKP